MTALREISAPTRHAGHEPELITASKVKERGWTNSLIKKLLAMPDDYAANMAYPGGAPVRLYRVERVTTIEASAEFRQAKEQSTKRQAASAKALDTKRETALKWIIAQPGPKLPAAPQAELTRLAVDWFNAVHAWRGDTDQWTLTDDAGEYIAIIITNYVINQLTDYETRLRRTIGKLPQPDDLAMIRGKTLAAIAAAYPWLAAERARRKSGSETR